MTRSVLYRVTPNFRIGNCLWGSRETRREVTAVGQALPGVVAVEMDTLKRDPGDQNDRAGGGTGNGCIKNNDQTSSVLAWNLGVHVLAP